MSYYASMGFIVVSHIIRHFYDADVLLKFRGLIRVLDLIFVPKQSRYSFI